MSLYTIAFYGGLLGYFIILALWRGIRSPDKFAEELSCWLDSNMLKSKPKLLRSKIDRYFRFCREVLFAPRWSILSVTKHILFAIGFGIAVFTWTLLIMQPFLEFPEQTSMACRLNHTLSILSLGLVDALSFGLFEVFGVDLRPKFAQFEARLLIYVFYVLTGVIVLRAIVLAVWEVWTVLLAILFPEPITRLANELIMGKEVQSRFRKSLLLITTLGRGA